MTVKNEELNFRPIIGIDLGTTNSAAAYIYRGKPELIQNQNGQTIIPSVVLIHPEGEVVVGEDARASLIAMPDRTKTAVKREMGTVDREEIAGRFYLPEEISAHILEPFKEEVDKLFGEGEKEAVITVPAYFTNEQRRATKKAGELAGFVVERIINEPTAAALAFGFNNMKDNRQLLVYDLGGGTFDVSIVEMMDGILEVKASAGNNELGGEDFDWLLVDYLAKEILKKDKVDPRTDIRAKALLKEEAEKAKIELSSKDSVEISLPIVMMKGNQPISLTTELTRETFKRLIKPLLQETMTKIQEVLEEGNIIKEDIDDILLVGGSTRIPYVHELIQDFFEKKPREDVNPDEAVALGAAVQAGLKSGALSESGMIVTDVSPFSMGIAVLKDGKEGAYEAIIDKNTIIPVTHTKRFYTSKPFQTMVRIEVYQGEEEWVWDNYFLNEFMLDGIPENAFELEEIDVTFRYNLNGILEVTAKSVSNGKEISAVVEDELDRSSEEAFFESIDRMMEEASKNQKTKNSTADEGSDYEQQDLFDYLEEDEEELSLNDLLEEAEEWKKRSEIKLEAGLQENQKKELNKAMEALTKAVDSKDKTELIDAIEDATDIFIEIDLEF